jgi:radical SAM protein with 4Fe4S-binding SPASM domain
MKVDVNKDYLEVLRTFAKLDSPFLSFMSIGKVNEAVLKIVTQERVAFRSLISRAGNVSENIILSPPELEGPLVCSANRLQRNVLLPNGDVTLCCMDFGRQHVIGNLLRDRYEDLHKSSGFKEILKLISGEKGELICRRCEFALPA